MLAGRVPSSTARPRNIQQSLTANNQNPTIASNSTTTGVGSRPQIADLITHIARQDNHLWQALNSLQNQISNVDNSVSNWAAFDPQIVDNFDNPLTETDMAAYYMISGQTLFVQINCQKLTFPVQATALQVMLPVNIGRIVIQTCAAYLMTTTNVNDVIMVEAYDKVADVYLRPVAAGTYPFAFGGLFLIFS